MTDKLQKVKEFCEKGALYGGIEKYEQGYKNTCKTILSILNEPEYIEGWVGVTKDCAIIGIVDCPDEIQDSKLIAKRKLRIHPITGMIEDITDNTRGE